MEINSFKSLFIEVKYDDIILGTATGFIVNYNSKYYLITNRHVVTGRNNQTNECMNNMGAIPNKINVFLPSINKTGALWNEITVELYDDMQEKRWLEHGRLKESIDVVALELTGVDCGAVCYVIRSEGELAVTDNVYIIGYPYGYSVLSGKRKVAIWTLGSVASEPELGMNINGVDVPAFLVDAKTRKGQSGSPVIYHNNNGFLRTDNGFAMYGRPVSFNVGIYSGRINTESDLGYVWKWSVIEEILNNNSEIQQLN